MSSIEPLSRHEKIRLRLFILGVVLFSMPIFPFSIAFFPTIFAGYALLAPERKLYDPRKMGILHLAPFFIPLIAPGVFLELSRIFFHRAGIMSEALTLISRWSYFGHEISKKLEPLSLEAQDLLAATVIFGLFSLPALYLVAPETPLMFRGIKYPSKPPRADERLTQGLLLKHPAVACGALLFCVPALTISMHFGLIGPSENARFAQDYSAAKFIANLTDGNLVYPLHYLAVNSLSFAFSAIMAGLFLSAKDGSNG
jgi:hypothetical protein